MPISPAILCIVAIASLALAGETQPPDPAPEPLWDSIGSTWAGEAVATKEWTDARGQPQRLELLKRAADGVLFYRMHAILAVCGDAGKESSCKLHLFDICFDEIGRFLGYRVDPRNPFTRAKHEPFRPDDYRTLDRILRDPVHILSTIKDQAEGVDAVSGATVLYVAEQAVPGAYYTSKAIWVLAQRTGPETVQAWTLERASVDDVRAWQEGKETLKLWWFLDNAEKSGLSSNVKVDLVYDLLTYPQPDVQNAALRFLHRTNAPFHPEHAQGDRYAQLGDEVKPDFLVWWRRQKYAPEVLVTAILRDLDERAGVYSAVTAHALDYLAAMKLTSEERCRATLQVLIEKSPSTYIRNLASKLLKGKP